ncbi:MAG TPA: dihydrofolate reductase [Rhizomicrobium sp.]|jgi:dihydrofolate reductase|nr:dihydrofolate reductase [Rhizomicrobium sp.]
MNRIALVVAKAANGVIGNRGTIPWRLPADMRRFKELTLGKPCIMGRKTWESLPKKPLPGRLNIVVTRDPHFRAEGAVVASSLDEARARAERENPGEICVIGGEEIYRAVLPRSDVIYLTEVLAEFRGNARFPPLAPGAWREITREEHVSADGLPYCFLTLERVCDKKV